MKSKINTPRIINFRNAAAVVATIGLLAATGCRKDDDEPKVSPVVEATNSTIIPIADAVYSGGVHTPVSTESAVVVNASGTIKDLSKMTLEMNVTCSFARDLSFALQAPDGTKKDFIYRAGSNGNYIAANLYRFNNTFTSTFPEGTVEDIAAGNYKESKGSLYPAVPIESIFSSFNGKQVNGTWKLIITDHDELVLGTLHSWKLHFAEGALQQ